MLNIIGSGVYIDNVDQQYRSELFKQLTIFSIGIAGLVFFTLVIGRSIISPIKSATMAMTEIAQGDGDLRVKLNEQGHDELAKLGHGFNQFSQKIRQVIIEVNQFGQQISISSNDLADVTEHSRNQIDNSQNETNQVATAVTIKCDGC